MLSITPNTPFDTGMLPSIDLKLSTASKGGVFNGGFELGTGTIPTSVVDANGWSLSKNITTFGCTYDNTVSHTGLQSIKLAFTTKGAGTYAFIDNTSNFYSGGDFAASQKFLLPIKASTTYRVSALVKTYNIDATAGVYVRFTEVGSTGTHGTSTDSVKISGTTDWTYYSKTVTTAVTATYARFIIGTISGTTMTDGSIMWVDDVTVEEVVSDTTFTGKVPEKIRPVLQAVTSTDNIDNSLDSAGAYANTYAIPNAVDEGATHRQTFTPTKKYLSQIGLWLVTKGTGNLDLTVHDASNVRICAARLTNAELTAGQMNYWTISGIVTAGNAYHIHITQAALDTNTVKANTSNDLETASYIQRYAKKTETFKLIHNGIPTDLKSNSSDGLLTNAIIDLDNGKYLYALPAAVASGYSFANDIYSCSTGGLTSFGVAYMWQVASTVVVQSATDGTARNIVVKVNTILPIKHLKIMAGIYSTEAVDKTIQISSDNVTYTTIETVNNATDALYTVTPETDLMNGKSVFYLKFDKLAVTDYLSLRKISIEADIDTSVIPTGLSYPIGATNQFTETVKLPAVATRVYYQATKYLNEYGVPMPALEFTDGSAVMIGYTPLKLDITQETNPAVRILSTTTNYQASGTGSDSGGYILNTGEYMTFTSTTAEIKVDYQVGAGTTAFTAITKNVYYLSSNGESSDATQDPSHQQNVIIGVRQQGLLDRVKDLGNEQAYQAIGQYQKKLELSGLCVGTRDNNICIDNAGEFIMNGTATEWEDLRTPMTAAKLGASHDPGFSLFIKNGASQGVFSYDFDKTTEEELYFAIQLPHSYKIGSTIYPHAHWGVKTAPAGGTTVRWGLEYTWVDINGTFAAPTIIYTTATDPVTQYKHNISSFTTIAGTTITAVSSMLLCRIFRDVANDNFDDDASLFEFDIHYEQDTLGSKTETAK